MNNRIMKPLIAFSLLLLFCFIPILTNAAIIVQPSGLVPCGGPNQNSCTACDLLVLVQNVLEFSLKIAFLVIVGFVVYGGFRWIFSLGKEENLKAGQQIITNAIIGLIIILTAWIIVNTVFWTIKKMGGDDYTGTWFNIECSEFDILPDASVDDETPVDPNYISPEDQIENEKNKIEEKYPDLEGEWIQILIKCPEWEDEDECDEASERTDCGVIDKKIKDGFCFATKSTTIISESEIMANGWFCNLKDSINSPNGKSFAYCVSENNETPVSPITPEPDPEPDPESDCTDCGGTWWSGDWCYEAECLALGNCKFTNIFGPGGKCEAN